MEAPNQAAGSSPRDVCTLDPPRPWRRFLLRVGFFWLPKMANAFWKEIRCSETGTHWKKTYFSCMITQTILYMRRVFFWVKCVGKQQGPILILGFGFFWRIGWRFLSGEAYVWLNKSCHIDYSIPKYKISCVHPRKRTCNLKHGRLAKGQTNHLST